MILARYATKTRICAPEVAAGSSCRAPDWAIPAGSATYSCSKAPAWRLVCILSIQPAQGPMGQSFSLMRRTF